LRSEPSTIESGNTVVRDAVLEQKLKPVVQEFPEVVDMHDVEIKRVRGKVYMFVPLHHVRRPAAFPACMTYRRSWKFVSNKPRRNFSRC